MLIFIKMWIIDIMDTTKDATRDAITKANASTETLERTLAIALEMQEIVSWDIWCIWYDFKVRNRIIKYQIFIKSIYICYILYWCVKNPRNYLKKKIFLLILSELLYFIIINNCYKWYPLLLNFLIQNLYEFTPKHDKKTFLLIIKKNYNIQFKES